MTLPRRIGALLAACAMGATTLVCAPSASAAPGDDAAVVNAWYSDFLYRPAYGDDGARYWLGQLNTQPPAEVLSELTGTQEYTYGQVEDYYRGLLGRLPDSGANYWIDGVLAQRFPLEWVVQNILASQEFANDNSDYLVNAWYGVLLGREGSRGEVAYWNRRVSAVGRLGALRELYYTGEAVRARVQSNYVITLDRQPSAGEYAYWYDREVDSDITVQISIASTPEYRSLAQ